jgi:hypothetical protein
MNADNGMADDEDYMRVALHPACQGWDAGEVPVGALVVAAERPSGAGSTSRLPDLAPRRTPRWWRCVTPLAALAITGWSAARCM